MKKYSDKHLESVPPEFIVAAERTVEMLEGGDTSDETCPSIIIKTEFGMVDYCVTCHGDMCPQILIYQVKFSGCPCHEFGALGSIKLLNNLIAQWRRWCGLED
jgi:hypothetical protein